MLNFLSDKKTFSVNSGTTFLLRDPKKQLDEFDIININCGTFVASSEINKKLVEKGASINCGSSYICDIDTEVIQLEANTILRSNFDYEGKCVLALGNLVLTPESANALASAGSVIVENTLYHPESTDPAALLNVRGMTRPYPDDAQLVLGSHTLEEITAAAQKEVIWVAGGVTALFAETFSDAKRDGLTVICDHLFSKEGLQNAAAGIIQAGKQTFIPDDHTVTGSIELTKSHLFIYGPKIYVRGSLTLADGYSDFLDKFESIIVEGCANINNDAAEQFAAIGKAGYYEFFDGRLKRITGAETLSHKYFEGLNAANETVTLDVTGFLQIDKDVTAEDMKAVASLSCTGAVILPGEAQSGLNGKIQNLTGFMGSTESIEQLTGLSFSEVLEKYLQSSGSVNTGLYIMV